MPFFRKISALVGAAAVTATAVAAPSAAPEAPTATPIKHLVIIYGENISFDHYFGTYPYATNPPGEPKFLAAPFTPRPRNLLTDNLLENNPNLNPENGDGATDPFRLDRTQAATSDQNHDYTPEQLAADGGKMDLFPKYTGDGTSGGAGAFGTTGQVMGYYDGNTVTALWNYAQHFALSDNAFGDTYGPSSPGAVEVVSGQTDGLEVVGSPDTAAFIDDGDGGYTMIGDVDPAGDVCSSPAQAQMTGKNIGDLLNARNISWGSFMGGFDLGIVNPDGSTGCARQSTSVYTGTTADYVPHHAWFQYYLSTANPTHARPTSVEAIGHTTDADGSVDPANHEYDVDDFFTAVSAGNFPAVSYLKAPAYEDGHAGYSDPLDEQVFVVKVVNFLEKTPEWKSTAIIITYDDSDGWYDHVFAKPTRPSADPTADQLDGPGVCGEGTPPSGLLGQPVNGRCGPGPRVPFIVISPWAKQNSISHTFITQASVVRFIEDNWLHGERLGGGSFDATTGSILDLFDFKKQRPTPPLFLDEEEGTPIAPPAGPFAPGGEQL